jgi:uncharacterized protein
MMHPEAKKYIENLHLEAHPEGGYYKEVYRSGEIILPDGLPDRYKKGRVVSTSIYFLLEGKQVSNFHRLKSDEIWHFYDGCGVKIFALENSGKLYEHRLGKKIEERETLQVVIKNGNWFAAELIDKNSFCLVGCSVSPGFEFDDFELAKRDLLLNKFPGYKGLILHFTGK